MIHHGRSPLSGIESENMPPKVFFNTLVIIGLVLYMGVIYVAYHVYKAIDKAVLSDPDILLILALIVVSALFYFAVVSQIPVPL